MATNPSKAPPSARHEKPNRLLPESSLSVTVAAMSQTSLAGILPSQSLDALIASGAIGSASAFDADQVQPASLDLRLGARCWRIRASFLPGLGRTVRQRMADVAMHEIDLTKGAGWDIKILPEICRYLKIILPSERNQIMDSNNLWYSLCRQ